MNDAISEAYQGLFEGAAIGSFVFLPILIVVAVFVIWTVCVKGGGMRGPKG